MYCSVDGAGNIVLTADYWAGCVSSRPIEAEESPGETTSVHEHTGSSIYPERQTGPHPRSIVPGPESCFASVPDLGTDRVVVYRLDLEAGALRETDRRFVPSRDGAGPRHLASTSADGVRTSSTNSTRR